MRLDEIERCLIAPHPREEVSGRHEDSELTVGVPRGGAFEARQKTRELGMEFRRTQMLNDDERLATALAQLVRRQLA